MIIQPDLVRMVFPIGILHHAEEEGAVVGVVDFDVDVVGGGVEGHCGGGGGMLIPVQFGRIC